MHKTLIMTGVTSGIGLEAALLLQHQGHHVFAGARSLDKARGLGLQNVHPLDLCELDSVRAFARACPQADGLIANAGVMIPGPLRTTKDGMEETFAVNHLAHLLLFEELRAKLTSHARVIFTGSGTHDPNERLARMFGFRGGMYTSAERLSRGDLGAQGTVRQLGMWRYATSKLANVMTVEELARRHSPEEFEVFGYNPGLVPATSLTRDQPAALRRIFSWLTPLLTKLPGTSTPQRSGAMLATLATSDAYEGRSGEHLDHFGRPAQIWEQAKAPGPCRELYEDSLHLLASTKT